MLLHVYTHLLCVVQYIFVGRTIVWIIGDSIIRRARDYFASTHADQNLGLDQVEVVWKGEGGLHLDALEQQIESHIGKYPH